MADANGTSTSQSGQPEREWVVYVLLCPTTKAVRYVGWTFNLKKRMYTHRYTATRFSRHRDCWVRKLMKSGLFPEAKVVEKGTGDWAEAEKRWIAHYRGAGADLTNLTDGGEGVVGLKMSPEVIERIRQQKLGKRQSPESVARRAAASRGRIVSSESRAKASVANTGKKRTPEQRARMSAAKRGRRGAPLSEEHKAKIVASQNRFYEAHPEIRRGRFHHKLGGQKFGMLKAIRFVGAAQGGKALWECRCDCGRMIVTAADRLRNGGQTHCGCSKRRP